LKTPPNKVRLTAPGVAKAPARPSAYLVWDSLQRGLALQVQPSGHRSFKVIYSYRGKPRWYHLGPADVVPLAEARKLAATIMAEVARGGDPQGQRKAQRTSGSFGELAEAYAAHARGVNKSWQQAEALVRRHLRPRWDALRAADITRADVRAALATITSPATANQVLASASAIFTWAVREEVGGIVANPCRGVSRHETRSRERILSDTELPRVWAAFDGVGLLRASALKVLLLTGQRPGEVRHMHHAHIDGGWWTLPGEPQPATGWPGTKNGASHRVWLPPPVQALVAEVGDGTGPVFTRLGSLDEAMREVCAALGLERATPHDLRRSHGSRVTELGFGREAMNRIQNHREGGIASVYDRYEYASETQRVMDAVAAHILVLCQG
jgi:integrase